MEPSAFEITSEHIRLRFDKAVHRVGLAAVEAAIDKSVIEQDTVASLDDDEVADYIEMLRNPDSTTTNQPNTEDEILDIEYEVRGAFGTIRGYRLGEVTSDTILLIKPLVDARYFRPSIQLRYNTITDEYKKSEHLATFADTVKPSVIYQPVTEDDHEVIALALQQIAHINRTLSRHESD